MIWNKYSIKTNTQDAELVCAALMDFDIFDVEIDDADADSGNEECFVNFYREAPKTPEEENKLREMAERVKEGLKEAEEIYGIAPAEFLEECLNSADWEDKWKEYFKPFLIDDIAVKPIWEELPEDIKEKAKVIIEIDPKTVFGSGLHETTKLCVRGLKKYMKPGDRVFDAGCGSGILSIIARKLGAESTVAVDIKPEAVDIVRENFEANGFREGFETFAGNILDFAADGRCQDPKLEKMVKELEKNPADVVVANILADVVEPLTGVVQKYMKVGGYYVISGIIDNKERVILDAIEANPHLQLVETSAGGEWRSMVAERIS